MALGDSVAELSERTPGELTPVAPACKLSGTPAAGSPPIFTDIWHKAAMLKGTKRWVMNKGTSINDLQLILEGERV